MFYQYPRVPNFTPFAAWRAFFEIQAILRRCTKWPPNDFEHYKLKDTLWVTCVPDFQSSLCFYLWPAIFEIQPFWDTYTKCNQNDLKAHMVPRYQICMLLLDTSSKFHPISLYGQKFSRYKPFWDKFTEWPQIDLEPYKVKLNSVRDSQILLHFVVWPAVFKIQAVLTRVHRMTPKWPWTLQCQSHMCPIYMLLVSTSRPKFHPVSLYGEPFLKYRLFREKCTK